MASTVQAPPPAPPPRPPRYRRSFAGPVVLIIVGIFFLLGNMGIISWRNFGDWFSNYWPVLLIVWGIIKLIEYQQASRAGERARAVDVAAGALKGNRGAQRGRDRPPVVGGQSQG